MAKRQTEATKAAPDVIDVGMTVGVSEDEQIAVAAGKAVLEFVRGVAAFFLTARELEKDALAIADEGRALRLPTSQAEDLELQKWIVRTSKLTKQVEEHWKITTTISAFHRRMTGRRAVSTDAIKTANDRGNNLHAQYVKDEERRVAAENERRRRESEQAEQDRRDRESAALEAEAVRREEASSDLTARETTFVELYMARGDGISAARAAGFKTPAKDAARLLTLAKIQAAIAAKKSAIAIRQQAAAVQAAPLIPDDIIEERPAVAKAAGTASRVTKSAELLDEAALIEAIFSGRYGIPRTILRVDPAALNQEARNLGDLINRWPGVRYKETPRVI